MKWKSRFTLLVILAAMTACGAKSEDKSRQAQIDSINAEAKAAEQTRQSEMEAEQAAMDELVISGGVSYEPSVE